MFWRDSHVFEEGSGALLLVLELGEGVAGTTNLPEHLCFNGIVYDASPNACFGDGVSDFVPGCFFGSCFIDGNQNYKLWNLALPTDVVSGIHRQHDLVVLQAIETIFEEGRVLQR